MFCLNPPCHLGMIFVKIGTCCAARNCPRIYGNCATYPENLPEGVTFFCLFFLRK